MGRLICIACTLNWQRPTIYFIRSPAMFVFSGKVRGVLTCTMALLPLFVRHDFVQTSHSISAIANLPVKQFMGAAKEGWGPYFRNLHSKMRREGAAHSTARRMNRPPPDRRRKPRQAPPPPRRAAPGAPTSSRAAASRRHSNPRQMTHGTNTYSRSGSNSRSSSSTDCLTRRRRREREDDDNFDGLAESRAKAARREEEEGVTQRMAMRLHALWQELKIPSPDQAYISATYLEAGGKPSGRGSGESKGDKGQVAQVRSGTSNPTSGDVHRELARQIRLLLEHRTATVKVRLHAKFLFIKFVQDVSILFKQWLHGAELERPLGLSSCSYRRIPVRNKGAKTATSNWRGFLS